jgi:predicted metal-dependent hydrolase
MLARRAPIDFEAANPLWTPAHPGFGHALNGGSSLLPYLEPYLIKVMKQARERIPAERRELHADLAVFIQQEANHYTTHARYNAVLRRHYTGLEAFEAKIHDDFERLLTKRSLRFNLAYSEGFECLGAIQAEVFFERSDALLAGADPAVTDLWRWHLAEEFEHRTVCHDVSRALAGGYFYRVAIFLYVLFHLNGHGRRVAKHLLAQDVAAGRVRRGWRMRLRALRHDLRAFAFALPRILAVLLPGYTPRRLPLLAKAERFLEGFAPARS